MGSEMKGGAAKPLPAGKIPAGSSKRGRSRVAALTGEAANSHGHLKLGFKSEGRKASHASSVVTVRGPSYKSVPGIDALIRRVEGAPQFELIELERSGVNSRLAKELAASLQIPVSRFYDIIGVKKATLESKAAKDKVIGGAGGQRVLAVARLLGQARNIVARSMAPGAAMFDAGKWLGIWIETPQPALGGLRPSDLLDTPTGFDVVAKTLGALESGAYL